MNMKSVALLIAGTVFGLSERTSPAVNAYAPLRGSFKTMDLFSVMCERKKNRIKKSRRNLRK